MSAVETVLPTAREVALRIIKGHFSESPGTLRAYLFPSDDEVRIVEVDPESPESDTVAVVPFYFRPAPTQGVPYLSGIALITPDEEKRLSPPDGWGDWQDAEVIEPE